MPHPKIQIWIEIFKQIKVSSRKLFYKVFKRYTILETRLVSSKQANELMESTKDSPESERWVLADIEDEKKVYYLAHLCRKVRIKE